jgi:hypothetical protein
MQAPAHSLKPASHSNLHVPRLQTGWAFATFVVQTVPQVPQLVVVLLETQTEVPEGGSQQI